MTVSRFVDLSDLPAVDGHCHPLLPDPWTLAPETFADLFTEGRPGTMSAHVPHTGYFRRTLHELARQLEAEPSVDAILARRAALGPEAARRVLAESRVEALLVDTGYPPGAMPLAEMRRLLPCAIHEVFRIETCAERLLAHRLPYEAFLEAFREELKAAAPRCVAFKSIVAYRSGLAIGAWPPAQAASAYQDVVARLETGGSRRLVQKPLLDTLFRVALEVAHDTDRPLQVHSGFGDPDIDLLQSNPLLLRPVLEDAGWASVRIVLLHMAYPYFREAAFLTAIYPQVFLDLSLALPFLGPGAVLPLTETLALAPSSKLLYGSDVGNLPELFALSADCGRAALGEALGSLIERGGLSASEGRMIGRQILSGNARALYALPP